MRVIIVDDEPLARDRLRAMLGKESDVKIIAECGDGREAVTAIRRENPDVVFLDIQMPEMDGFGVLSQLKGQTMPRVIFVTAFDEFAVKAFEVHALDYLLKPFDRDRLQQALGRVREQLKSASPAELTEKLTALLDSFQGGAGDTRNSDRIAVKLDGRVIFVRPGDIDWIEAQDNYVKLHVGREAHLVRDTLSNFETRLDTRRFIRIARSTIVNIDRVREMQPMFHGEYVVILHDGSKLTMSRGYRETLQQYLGGK
ncbi:MAG: response regulator transcription factor [Verrucomicrobiales bacterium]|nr:response regulator transcription factor [Verrucomicrobiales bacterium]